MLICICNALNEEAVRKLSWEDYKKIRQCGSCVTYCKGMLSNSFKKAKTTKRRPNEYL